MHIALRNVYRYRKRYFFLGVAVVVGSLLVTVVSGAVGGALDTVREKAARYFAGDVSVIGYDSQRVQRLRDPEALMSQIDKIEKGIAVVSPRTVYYRTDCSIFHSGESIRQRRLVGVDFEKERIAFGGMDFLEGSLASMVDAGASDGILISEAASSAIFARVGDEVDLFLTTDTGQYNSATLKVKGVFRETGFFGYVAYMDRRALNRLVGRADGAATDMAIFAKKGTSKRGLARTVWKSLSGGYRLFPELESREELAASISFVDTADESLAILELDGQLAQIKNLMDALLAVAYFVMAVFIAIVMVGIRNTYLVLVHERTKEIGTMRALGMHKSDVSFIFLMEAAILGSFAAIVGFFGGWSMLALICRWEWIKAPVADIFLRSGKLHYSLSAVIFIATVAAMTAAVGLAAWKPSRIASGVDPVRALRGEC